MASNQSIHRVNPKNDIKWFPIPAKMGGPSRRCPRMTPIGGAIKTSLSFAPSAIFMFPPKYWVLGAIAKTRGPSGAASQVVHRLRNKNVGVYELALPPGLTPITFREY